MFRLIENSRPTTIYYGGDITHEILSARSRKELFENDIFREKIRREVERAIYENGVKLLSLDVFDTVLIRNAKCEMRRFLEMADAFAGYLATEIGIGINSLDVFVARIIATKLSYRYSPAVKGCREGSLVEIHEHLCKLLAIPAGVVADTLTIEIDYEVQSLNPNPLVPTLLEVAISAGIPVALISDMYMGRDHIATLLKHHFPENFEVSGIFSSGDLKLSKRSGLLFDFVAEQFDVQASQAFHVGDNLASDFISARRRGWGSLYLPHTDEEVRVLDDDENRLRAELDKAGISLDRLIGDG